MIKYKKNYLKCSGSTFKYHIGNNFKKEEVITFDRFISSDKIIKKIETHLSLLTKEQKDKIKVIYGHTAYYGIHKFFNKPHRYVTFIRNPIDRTISLYNFLMTRYYKTSRNKKIWILMISAF